MKNLKLFLMLIAIMPITNAWSSTSMDTSFTFNKVKHKLYLSIPSSYDAQKEYPLVISLHWCPGATIVGYGKDFRNAFAKFADSLQVIVACPDNTGSAISDGDIGILKATVDTVNGLFKINENEVYLTGMSCNGYVTVRQGLKKAYPFKGVFAWDPWIPSIKAGEFDYNSTMPIVLAIGSTDENYSTILSLYDSLKTHHAKVDLVIVENVGHTYNFSSFTNNMVRCFRYLNDTNAISISKVENFEIYDTAATKNVVIVVTNKSGKKITCQAISSLSGVMSNPTIVNQDNGNVKINLIPKIGKSGNVRILFEVRENDGMGIEQMIFNVKVNKAITSINNNDSQNKLSIFPNPANHIINIKNAANVSKLVITDLSGRQMTSVFNPGQINQLDISNLRAGVYLVKTEGEKNMKTKLIVFK